jgi:hypothetical protein
VPVALPQLLQQTRRMWPSQRLRLVRSREKMHPHHRMSMKVGRRRLPGRWKPQKL